MKHRPDRLVVVRGLEHLHGPPNRRRVAPDVRAVPIEHEQFVAALRALRRTDADG